MTKRTLYLANPFGFPALATAGPLRSLVEALEDLGAVVWEPFTNIDTAKPDAPQWAWRAGQANIDAVRQADGVFAVLNGSPPDKVVAVELRLAIAWRKPVFFFRDDFRRCSDSDAYPLNLMLFGGYTAEGWRLVWYDSLDDLANPSKGLAHWLSGGDVVLVEPAAGDGASEWVVG